MELILTDGYEVSGVFDAFIKLHPYKVNNKFIFTDLEHKGIKEITVSSRKNAYDKAPDGYFITHNIRMIVNLGKVIHPDDTLTLFNEHDLPVFVKRFDEVMDLIGFPHLLYWKVLRVDYSINVKLTGKNKGHVSDYIKILQNGNKPTESQESYNRANRNYTQRSGSCYLIVWRAKRNKNKKTFQRDLRYIINFYDKEDEIKNNLEEKRNASDVLRLEIQCKKPMLQSIQKKKKIKNMRVIHFLRNNFAEELILETVKQLVGTGDFLQRNKGEQIIKKANFKASTKADMIQIYKYTSSHGNFSLSTFRHNLPDGMTIKTFESRLKAFDKIGLSPIGLSRNKGLKDGLESLYKLAQLTILTNEGREDLVNADPGELVQQRADILKNMRQINPLV